MKRLLLPAILAATSTFGSAGPASAEGATGKDADLSPLKNPPIASAVRPPQPRPPVRPRDGVVEAVTVTGARLPSVPPETPEARARASAAYRGAVGGEASETNSLSTVGDAGGGRVKSGPTGPR